MKSYNNKWLYTKKCTRMNATTTNFIVEIYKEAMLKDRDYTVNIIFEFKFPRNEKSLSLHAYHILYD